MSNIIESPMPGSILSVNVKEGDDVKKGQVVMVLEAMKMENDITADCDGKVGKIFAQEGDAVPVGGQLIEII